MWGATGCAPEPPETSGISIHAPRVGSDSYQIPAQLEPVISIHAPRVGSDEQVEKVWRAHWNISIHAPRVGSDRRRKPAEPLVWIFQSTLPVWGATDWVIVD